MKERLKIFKNASLIGLVKKKGNTLKYWYNHVAVLSNSYIYFYPIEDKDVINEAMIYFNNGALNFKRTDKQISSLDLDQKDERGEKIKIAFSSRRRSQGVEPASERRRSTKLLGNKFTKLNYEEYYLVKGCQKI